MSPARRRSKIAAHLRLGVGQQRLRRRRCRVPRLIGHQQVEGGQRLCGVERALEAEPQHLGDAVVEQPCRFSATWWPPASSPALCSFASAPACWCPAPPGGAAAWISCSVCAMNSSSTSPPRARLTSHTPPEPCSFSISRRMSMTSAFTTAASRGSAGKCGSRRVARPSGPGRRRRAAPASAPASPRSRPNRADSSRSSRGSPPPAPCCPRAGAACPRHRARPPPSAPRRPEISRCVSRAKYWLMLSGFAPSLISTPSAAS